MRSFDVSVTKLSVLLIGFLAFGAFTIYERQVTHPRAIRLTTEFQNLSRTEILSIRLSPAVHSSLVNQPMEISPERVEELLAFIREATPFQPSHPAAEWICEMTIATRRNQFAASLAATSNNGLLIYLKRGITLRSDPMRAFLKRIAEPAAETHRGAAAEP